MHRGTGMVPKINFIIYLGDCGVKILHVLNFFGVETGFHKSKARVESEARKRATAHLCCLKVSQNRILFQVGKGLFQ